MSEVFARDKAPLVELVAPVISPSRYRGDIDGLRALAVLAVIFTHAGFGAFPGGYLGVDIFFVISGYLIHRDLIARFRDGRFSLAGFYGRRMRRTMPALYLVGAATFVASCFVLMPGDLDEMARSLIGAVLLVPNFVFLSQTGYFDTSAIDKPLLHTWSLGVEEQFYLLAPLLPLGLGALGARRRRPALLLLSAVALAGAVAMRRAAPSAAFYLMPARVFEFLIGAILAEDMVPTVQTRWIGEVVAVVALLGLVYAITSFSNLTPHPGLATLLPCCATAAIIHVGRTRKTIVGAALALRGSAFIGLVSYSLYLWHWPIITLAHYADIAQTRIVLAIEGALCLCLSVLSWRFVEQPFRDPKSPWRRHARFILPASAVTLLAVCVATVLLRGVPGRFPPDVASVASYYAYRNQRPFREGTCFITSKNRLADYDPETCLKMSPGKPNVLLIGDSQAAHYWTGLRDTWPAVNFLQTTASGCKPVLASEGAARCTSMMKRMFDDFIPSHRLDAVVISALWEKPDLAALLKTIEALKPRVKRVIVFGPMPRYDQPAATLIAKSMLDGDLAGVARHRLSDTKALDAEMHDAIAPLATYVSTYTAMCPGGACRVFAAPGVPMQFDYHHLTTRGAERLMGAIQAQDGQIFERQGGGGRGETKEFGIKPR